jgi:site-specific recombinase XerD
MEEMPQPKHGVSQTAADSAASHVGDVAADDASLASRSSPTPRRRPETLQEAILEYEQFLAAENRAKHTRASFGLDLRLFTQRVHERNPGQPLGEHKLTQLGEPELRDFISWVRDTRKNSPVSVRRKVASLKNLFAYLYRERLIGHDPALRLIYPEIYPALPEFLEDQSVGRLLEAASEHLFWHSLIALMLDTGLKRDEVVALGWSDVSLDESENRESYLVVRETEQAKRLRSRRLELSSDVANLLRAYKAREPQREHFFDISPRGVNFIIETCGYRAEIVTRGKKLTPQILRATYAVRRMRSMVAEEETMRIAGGEEAAFALIEVHDLQLLRLLGLHEEPESAQKYRKLVHGWDEHTASGLDAQV